jgi:hypothetical protein
MNLRQVVKQYGPFLFGTIFLMISGLGFAWLQSPASLDEFVGSWYGNFSRCYPYDNAINQPGWSEKINWTSRRIELGDTADFTGAYIAKDAYGCSTFHYTGKVITKISQFNVTSATVGNEISNVTIGADGLVSGVYTDQYGLQWSVQFTQPLPESLNGNLISSPKAVLTRIENR